MLSHYLNSSKFEFSISCLVQDHARDPMEYGVRGLESTVELGSSLFWRNFVFKIQVQKTSYAINSDNKVQTKIIATTKCESN